MAIKYKIDKSFAKDLQKHNDKSLELKVKNIILNLQEISSIKEIPNIKKLKGEESAFRIRIGTFRIGLLVVDDILIFVRILHRKEIYKRFP